MLAPYHSSGQLEVLLHHQAIAAETQRDKVTAVHLQNTQTRERVVISASYILDATELGDMLELARIEHVMGSESQAQTNELHAPKEANPFDQQAVTWCFAVEYREGEHHVMEKPSTYDFWRNYTPEFWCGPLFNWTYVNPISLEPIPRPMLYKIRRKANELPLDFWHYRRIACKDYYHKGYANDITLVNWPQNDYWLGPLVGVSKREKKKHLEAAKQLSLSFLYWLQTEAPRHDGGYGYPELRLRKDIVGTGDGLAKQVYIRESRRIQAEFTVLEQHIGVEQRGKLKSAKQFADRVGLGSYRIDLHPSSSGRNYVDISSYPFQIPLGALIPKRVENLLPACKNIGTTHITNGCYRLHPVEWNVGEVAGALAAYCLNKKLTPRQVRNTKRHLHNFQTMLEKTFGIALEWPKAIRTIAR
jgi:hypothetical protein